MGTVGGYSVPNRRRAALVGNVAPACVVHGVGAIDVIVYASVVVRTIVALWFVLHCRLVEDLPLFLVDPRGQCLMG